MKTQIVKISAGLMLVFLLGCDNHSQARLNQPDSHYERQVKEYDEQTARQEAVFAKQVAEYNEQTKKAEALLKAQEEQHKKAAEMMAKQEILLKQQEDSMARWAKILTTWERQQEQYQTYLDSLKK